MKFFRSACRIQTPSRPVSYTQGYHRSRTKNKDGWGKFDLITWNKTTVSVCTTNVWSYVCLFISRNHLLQQRLILEFLVVSVTENVFFACLFL